MGDDKTKEIKKKPSKELVKRGEDFFAVANAVAKANPPKAT